MFEYTKDKDAINLYKGHKFDAGFDLACPKDILCKSHKYTVIDTGIHIKLAPHEVAFIQPRSSTSSLGIFVITGTVDAGYTGSIKIQLINFTDEDYTIQKGQRIAQIVVTNNSRWGDDPKEISLQEYKNELAFLDNRGEKGFGSTGITQ